VRAAGGPAPEHDLNDEDSAVPEAGQAWPRGVASAGPSSSVTRGRRDVPASGHEGGFAEVLCSWISRSPESASRNPGRYIFLRGVGGDGYRDTCRDRALLTVAARRAGVEHRWIARLPRNSYAGVSSAGQLGARATWRYSRGDWP
jgi:hypothetical protein